ncbi:hypothetical protein [Streptomyces xiaopingdaonensis]|uniref:hypothetical protein n=1 Tax=Streptomyces xiaopingdaonensis TaxID=1565415 RepID=UPI00036CC8FF|nr:hypothetical protein [Streptomyces xiaopingdaonensis]
MSEDAEGRAVFVDSSGGRRRVLRRIGVGLGVVALGYGAMLGLSIVGGNATAPSVLIPGQDDESDHGTVKVEPSASSSGTPDEQPDIAAETAGGTGPGGDAAGGTSGAVGATGPATAPTPPAGRPSPTDVPAPGGGSDAAAGGAGGTGPTGPDEPPVTDPPTDSSGDPGDGEEPDDESSPRTQGGTR